MIAKSSVLFVLLGVALVMAAPEQPHAKAETKVQLTESQERSIEEVWEKLKSKFSRAIEIIKATWKAIREKGEKIANMNLKPIKDKGLKLIQDAKEVYKQIISEGKAAEPDVNEIKKSLKGLVVDLRHTSAGAYDDAKDLVHEVVETVKHKLSTEHLNKE